MLSLSAELQTRSELRFFGRVLEPRFRSDIERSACGNRSITFFGEVDHRECLSQMAACDVILVPSRHDPLPLVALDALSLGKPIVCSPTAGISEYLQDGRSGLIMHENTAEEIGRMLARVVADTELRRVLGQGARAVYESTFTTRRFAENLEAALGLGRPASIAVGGDEPPQKSAQWSPARSGAF